jgi:ADP-ribose pyrophosphatase YjhB (NUDIX family)
MPLKIEPPDYKFCPFCGQLLIVRIEEERERKFCGHCKWTYYPNVSIAVAGIILQEGKVLLVKRAKRPFLGTWMFPAGFVEFGEHPIEAIEREILEELGRVVTKVDFYDIFQSTDDPRSMGHVVIYYMVKVGEVEFKITDKEENLAIDWFDVNHFPEIGWKTHREVAKRLQKAQEAEKEKK